MTTGTTRGTYTVTIHGWCDAGSPAKLARIIIDRWMPNNAGGVHLLVGIRMAQSLRPFFERAKATGRDIRLRVSVPHTIPVIDELTWEGGAE